MRGLCITGKESTYMQKLHSCRKGVLQELLDTAFPMQNGAKGQRVANPAVNENYDLKSAHLKGKMPTIGKANMYV